ncbi:maleylpyruvate isomerase family mycothiol-dependent enzyme [Streptomyces sp. NPDC050355]|uniref:maleylpyruvate isomerase family mycothiol-dependent enzyme n=1 Tax=Streptomyces sp. NPDC050355 TaxID=3365609 RepID=UPI0037AA229B
MAASTDRFVRTVKALTDAEVGGPTLVPPWTRGHVITHVARAADSLCRLLAWARTGVETPQYADMDTRAAEIEAGARRPVDELLADVLTSAERFDDALRTLPEAAWSYQVRMRTGELRTPDALVLARLRELEVHHVDLATGYTFAQVPPQAARWIIDDLIAAQRRREDVPPMRIEATDTDLAHELGTGGPTIRGARADLLGWLTGRTDGTGLTTSRPGPVLDAPYWI